MGQGAQTTSPQEVILRNPPHLLKDPAENPATIEKRARTTEAARPLKSGTGRHKYNPAGPTSYPPALQHRQHRQLQQVHRPAQLNQPALAIRTNSRHHGPAHPSLA